MCFGKLPLHLFIRSTGRLSPALLPVLFLIILSAPADAQPQRRTDAQAEKKSAASAAKKVYTTRKVNPTPPVIDGKLNDPAWQEVSWAENFTQRQPVDNAPPTEKTAFKILYDDRNLYVGIRAFDRSPGEIVRRMSRRDGFEGDWVEINIDSYNDKRSAFSFTASVSGVKGDEAVSNNGDIWDSSWDPIWYLKTSIDDQGWIAEIRIPLSQLRFAEKEDQVWGLQVNRKLFRREETSNWQYIPQNSTGWVHLFGELHGLKGIRQQKQIEIQPYIVASAQTFEKQPGNPFATGNQSDVTTGLDGKIGITSDVTLDFTINPDFGQVEADPSQVNLSAFETFFEERRPFFIESRNILDYQLTSSVAGGNYTSDNLFYSRRIGRQPQYTPETREGEYLRQPVNSSILGALKLTGKTHKGLSFALLESVTGKEKAEIDFLGERRSQLVEPLTNYLVARVQQDFNKGNTIIGGMVTATNRRINEDYLRFMPRSAYTAGVDFRHSWKDRQYFVSGNALFSNVSGDQEALLALQRSSLRYFQRPTASHVGVDSTRNALTGTGATLKAGKSGSGHIRFESGITYRSPQLELNDIGYQRSADMISWWSWIGYQTLKPFGIFRNLNGNANAWQDMDFGGRNTYRAVNVNFNTQFKNFWRFGSGATPNFGSMSNADLRGGPSLRYPGGISFWYWVNSDSRKKFQVNFEQDQYNGNKGYSQSRDFYLSLTYRPVNALVISASPAYHDFRHELQYIATRTAGGQPRYITGDLHQRTLSTTLRIDYTVTPNLSVQYYGQPFASRGSYSGFKQITASLAGNYEDRFAPFAPGQVLRNADNTYSFDENADGVPEYGVANPDFSFLQYRSNLVVRWEYIPGSTLFLVWSQNRTGSDPLDRFSVADIGHDLFGIKAHNVFLVKFTYRFIL